ncbi:hypothetical protein AF384_24720, partial [Salmonella enterica subsp. enterica serovar Typhimurium]
MPGLIAASADQVGDFIGNYASFSRTRSCQHQAGAGDEFDSVLLAGIYTHGNCAQSSNGGGIVAESEAQR